MLDIKDEFRKLREHNEKEIEDIMSEIKDFFSSYNENCQKIVEEIRE